MIIPDSWESTNDFAKWYVDNGNPFLPPHNVEIFRTDDATSFCMFRHGQFQVELYLIYPQPNIPIHEHPGVEVVEVAVINGTVEIVPVLFNGQSHGLGIRNKADIRGFPLISIQRWHPKIKPTTVSSQWKGNIVGPMHEELIKRFHPNAYIVDGYADVTRTKDELE